MAVGVYASRYRLRALFCAAAVMLADRFMLNHLYRSSWTLLRSFLAIRLLVSFTASPRCIISAWLCRMQWL